MLSGSCPLPAKSIQSSLESADCCNTVTKNVDVPTVPVVSVALHVTKVEPTENCEFDDGVHVGPLAMPSADAAVGCG